MRKLTISAAVLLVAGCAAHGAVPLEETSGYAPETIRQMLTDKVFVLKGPRGIWTAARYFRPGGGNDYCSLATDGRIQNSRGTWTVGADSRDRATYQLATVNKRGRLYVPHYDPESGELKFRRRDGRGGWVTGMRGWLQESWPKSMAERCPGLAAGVPVDERQTGTTLAELRRQTPDAALKGLATPLPPPAGKQSSAPASGVSSGSGMASAGGAVDAPLPELTDEDRAGLVAMGVPERMLPAFEDQAITPELWARLLEKGFTVEDIAAEASAPVERRAQDYALRVVSVRDGVATLRSSVQDWNVREGDDVYTIGRVARITTDGDVWLQGMSEPLPRAAR